MFSEQRPDALIGNKIGIEKLPNCFFFESIIRWCLHPAIPATRFVTKHTVLRLLTI